MTKSMLARRAPFAASAALIALCASPAFAQDATEQQSTASAADEEVIIVTAQKREENLQDVPVSISVIGGEDLVESGSAQLADFANYVPGLQVDNFGTPGQSRVALRGISPMGAGGAIGIYVDDAPVGSSTVYTESALFTLDLLPYDIARVEVLRGPQGTLYGASAMGGLLKYVTVSPDLNEFSGRAGIEAIDIAHGGVGYGGQAFVNVPLATDKAAITASIAHRNSPGWVDNIQTGEDDENGYKQTGARVSLLFRPVEEFSIRLSALYQEVDADAASVTVADLNGDPIDGDNPANFTYLPEAFESEFTYLAATLDYDFGFASLSSTTTYTDAQRFARMDASRIYGPFLPLLTGGAVTEGILPFDNTIPLEKITEEVRLTSASSDSFEWMAGFFYTHEDAGNIQVVNTYDMEFNPIAGLDPLATAGLPSTYEEYAVFANATLKPTPKLWISGGLRWAHNDQTFQQVSGGIAGETLFDGESSESVVTWSLSPQYHVSEDMMVYGRVATGYRPGGPNVVFPGLPPTFDADTLTNYELGFKANLSGTVTFDAALFQMDWDDIQISISESGVSGLGNGSSARSRGIEAALLWDPVPGLTFGVNGAHTQAELSEDAPELGGLKGDPLPRIPKFSGSLTANYEFLLGEGAEARVGGGLRHTGSRNAGVGDDSLDIPAYTAVDLNGSVTFGGNFTIRAYVRNLTNEYGPMGRSLVSDAFGTDIHMNVSRLQPRTIGLALDVGF